MNLPDFTLLLQIANFMIAYIFMRLFIFAPALKILQQQDSYKKFLQQNIEIEKLEQKNIFLKQKQLWQQAKNSLYSLIPKLSKTCVRNYYNEEQVLPEQHLLSSQEKKVLVEKLCDQLSDVEL